MRRALAMGSFGATLLSAGLAAAEYPSSEKSESSGKPIEEITILGEKPALTVLSVDSARQTLERTAGGVDLVPSEEFRNGRAATLKDVLDYVPGVFVQPKFGEDSRFSIRGSGLSRNNHLRGVRLLVDGVPINTSDGSGDFQEIEPLSARYVEVYKGANALRLGASYLGGAVNLVMPSGRDASPVLARVETGSFGYMRAQAATGGQEGRWDYFASGTTIQQDSYREHGAQENVRFSGNLGFRISETAETRMYLTYNDIDQEIPGTLTRDQALRNPRAAVPNNVRNDNKRDIRSFRAANKTTFQWNDDTQVTFGGYALAKHLDHPIFQVIDSHYRDFGAFGQVERQTAIAGLDTELLFGMNFSEGNTVARRSNNLLGDKNNRTVDAREHARTIETYAEGRLKLTPALTLIGGAHMTNAVRSLGDRFPVSAGDPDDSDRKDYDEFSPRVGLLWESDSRWQLFANLSRAAEAPTFQELNPTAAKGFVPLDAQESVTAEVGVRGRLDWVRWDVSLYHARLRDELQMFQVPNPDNPGAPLTQARNADDTIHQGAEVGLDVRLAQGLLARGPDADQIWLRQAYTFSNFKFDDDDTFGSNDLPGAPENYYRGEIAYQHPAGLSLSANVEWVPEGYYVDNANTVKTEKYALLGVKAKVDLPWDGLSLFVDARNLANKKYIASTSVAIRATESSTLFNPGDGRAFYVGVELRR